MRQRRRFDHIVNGKRGDLGDIYWRSAAEANFGRYLRFMVSISYCAGWQYEPETFWFTDARGRGRGVRRGITSYKPDFRVEWTEKADRPGVEFIEVKGYNDAGSKVKLRRMAIYYPEIRVRLVTSKQIGEIGRRLAPLIKGWE